MRRGISELDTLAATTQAWEPSGQSLRQDGDALNPSRLRQRLREKLNNQYERDRFVAQQLSRLEAGALILDAGCGSQRYRPLCAHLRYRAQDFGGYAKDDKVTLLSASAEGQEYQYGPLDYVGDIWRIAERDATFDAILCTEVLEHIPYPAETVQEFGRLLKSGGRLILTAPFSCLRHQDPYFFFSGFSDRWYEKFLTESGLTLEAIEPVGDYNSWVGVELARTAARSAWWVKALLAPAFLYFFSKGKTVASTNTLCMGYHIVARKI